MEVTCLFSGFLTIRSLHGQSKGSRAKALMMLIQTECWNDHFRSWIPSFHFFGNIVDSGKKSTKQHLLALALSTLRLITPPASYRSDDISEQSLKMSLRSAEKITTGLKSLEQLQKYLPSAEFEEQIDGNHKYKDNDRLVANVIPLLRDLGLDVRTNHINT